MVDCLGWRPLASLPGKRSRVRSTIMDEKTRSQGLSKPWKARRHKAAPEARHRLRGVVPHGATLEKHAKTYSILFFWFDLYTEGSYHRSFRAMNALN